EENCPNIEETFWRETNHDDIGSSERLLDVDVRWSREDLPVIIIEVSSLAQHSEDVGLPTQNTRGRIQKHNVHSRRERKLIPLNRLNQLVGPTDEVVTDLSSFLGTLARTATLCPFDIFERNMDTKKDLWDYTMEKYIIPEAVKAEMEEIETQMDTNDQSVDAFSAVIGPEHPGCLRLYGVGVTKTTLKRKAGNSEQSSNDTNDVVQQMKERIQKMEKQMEEQKKTVRQEVITNVISQLQHAGIIDRNILAALSIPSPRETCTSAQAADQGDETEKGDESSIEDMT
ncbi:hypothetical protein H5410_036765, partial [Solanum commersonii]